MSDGIQHKESFYQTRIMKWLKEKFIQENAMTLINCDNAKPVLRHLVMPP